MPRTSARAHTCTAVYTRASCVPRNQEHEKDPRAEEPTMTLCKKSQKKKKIVHITTVCINVFFLTCARFSPAPERLFSRSRLRGTHGARLYTRCKFGSRVCNVARALGDPSRKIWQAIAGSLSVELEPSKPMENLHVSHCGKAQQHGNNNRFKLSSVLQLRTLACVDHCYTCVVMMYACMRCVCAPCMCARVYGAVHDEC